jgi:hypothetical protein
MAEGPILAAAAVVDDTWCAVRSGVPFGHHGLDGTPAQGLGMVGSPIGSGFSTTVPFGVG